MVATFSIVMAFLVGLAYSSTNTCPGCPQEQDPSAPEIQHYLKTTLTHFKAPPKGTDNELTTLVRVTRVTSQVVSGILYTYDFMAKGVKTHKLYACHMVVLSQPWAEGDVVEEYQCQPFYLNTLQRETESDSENEMPHKPCFGCSQQEKVDSPSVRRYLTTTLTHLKAPAKGTDNERTTLVRVTRVTSQVVSGILYNYEFEAKGVKTHKLYACHMVVLSQPWAAGDTVEEYECQPHLNAF